MDEYNLDDKNRVTYFGLTDFRGNAEKFGIKADDRTRHTYVIGKTGMGKSTLLENMAIQDIQNGEGLCFVDPHGTTAEKLLKYVPAHRINDVVYFAPFDTKYPMSLNVLEHVDKDKSHLVSSGLMDTFKKVFGEDVFSGRMVYLLNNAIASILENEGESILGINRIFSDKDYRKKIVSNVSDPALISFWRDEFSKYDDKYVKEATASIQNKIGQFMLTPMIRNIVGQAKSSFDLREIMDNRKILICNFSIGQTGSENVALIGSLLITQIYLAAMSRANLSYEELQKSPPFYFYVDEFQNFVNDSFAQILSQARKYNLGLIVANQHVEEQLTDKVRAAIFGNVGTFICFRIGAPDAELIEREFAPKFLAEDLVNLGARQIYLKLSIDGTGSKPFSARTLSPIENSGLDIVPAIIASSRAQFAKEKKYVEEEISNWYQPIIKPKEENTSRVESSHDNNYYKESKPPQKRDQSERREFVGSTSQNSRRAVGEFREGERTIKPSSAAERILMKPRVATAPPILETKAEIKSEITPVAKSNNSLRDALSNAIKLKEVKEKPDLNKKIITNDYTRQYTSKEELEKIMDLEN